MNSCVCSALCFVLVVASASAALAQDCSKAKDTAEKAICSDAGLQRSDSELNLAYQSLRKSRGTEEQRVLKNLQQGWLSGRYDACSNTKGDAYLACLRAYIEQRTAFLRGANGEGAGNQGRLRFVGYYKAGETAREAIEVSLYEFAEPNSAGQRSFNAEVERRLAGVKKEYAPDEELCKGCQFELKMEQPFQHGAFLSAPVESWEYSGGAHGGGGTDYLNFDFAKGREMTLADLFLPAGTQAAAKLCYDNLLASEKGQELELPEDDNGGPPAAFLKAFRNMTNWSFDSKKATVHFGLYVLGGYAAGMQSCDLPYRALQRQLRAGTSLPGAAVEGKR